MNMKYFEVPPEYQPIAIEQICYNSKVMLYFTSEVPFTNLE